MKAAVLSVLLCVVFACAAPAGGPECDVAERCQSASVGVTLSDYRGSGTVVVVCGRQYVLTAAHVLSRGQTAKAEKKATIYGAGKADGVELSLVKIDEDADLALMRPTKPLVGVRSAKVIATRPRVGQRVFTVGCPSAADNFKTVTAGIVSFVGRDGGKQKYTQTDAAIVAGSSGGGLFDARTGNLIGVVVMQRVGRANYGLCVPGSAVAAFLKSAGCQCPKGGCRCKCCPR